MSCTYTHAYTILYMYISVNPFLRYINILIFGPFFLLSFVFSPHHLQYMLSKRVGDCKLKREYEKIAFMFQQIESYQPITIYIELLSTSFTNDILPLFNRYTHLLVKRKRASSKIITALFIATSMVIS